MTVRWSARQHGWPLDHVEVLVDHARKQPAGAPQPADVFDKTIILRGARLDHGQRARLIEIAAKCPVQRVLQSSPLVNTRMGTPLDEGSDT